MLTQERPAFVGVLREGGARILPERLAINIGIKIRQQMATRGWTMASIEQTIRHPTRTVRTMDTRHVPGDSRMNDPATAYINLDGSYVVRNDSTGDIVQISHRHDPNWHSPFA